MPEPIAEQEPVQIAKVVQPVPEDVVIVEEDLVQALGDVFFDYDRIREDAVPALTNNANLLTASLADTKIVIEGHCDERGTRSYNMILGERRAQAVKTYLEDLGVPADNLQVVSYGKDKPFCMEQSQECWQENRRGHFILK
jgi:peptidoglycan-associated lipoprotein